MPELTTMDFARAFGTTPDDLSQRCREIIAQRDFRYEVIEGPDRDRILLTVLKKIDSDTQVVGAPERTDAWGRGWAENLNDFVESGFSHEALVPRFLRENQVLRYGGEYIQSYNPRFELDFITVFRTWLFEKYFAPFDSVYEFGCGTGFNLVLLADLFPEKQLYGLDFVQSSVDLIGKIRESGYGNIDGCLFDMISPPEYELHHDSAIFTFGTVEQLSGRFESFLLYLLNQRPKLCAHVEPTIELYDQDKLFDFVAMKFHRKRGYTEKFLPRLQELERQNKIEILKIKRLNFGSLLMEGYTYFVWRPL